MLLSNIHFDTSLSSDENGSSYERGYLYVILVLHTKALATSTVIMLRAACRRLMDPRMGWGASVLWRKMH